MPGEPVNGVPSIVAHCIKFLRENGVETEGLFRISGKIDSVRAVVKLYDGLLFSTILLDVNFCLALFRKNNGYVRTL